MTTCSPTATLRMMKQGDNLSIGGFFTGFDGTVSLTASLNDPLNANAKVADLSVTLGPYVDAATERTLLLEAPASATATWPVGQLRGDLKFAEPGGLVIHSQTFIKPVARAETT